MPSRCSANLAATGRRESGVGTAVGACAGGLAWLPVAWRGWLFDWPGYAQWAVTVALIALFPDGLGQRTPSQRRTAQALIAVAVAVTGAAMLLEPVGRGSVMGPHTNPAGLGVLPAAVADVLILPVAAAVLGSVIGLRRRSRAVTGAARRQYTWVLFAFSVVIAGLAIGLLFSGAVGDVAWLPIIAGWFGPLPVAAATLAAAAAFSPVRRGVQRWVDRRFNRARFDARRELDVFAARLRSNIDLDTVVAEISALVATTLQPSTSVTWIRATRPAPEHPAGSR